MDGGISQGRSRLGAAVPGHKWIRTRIILSYSYSASTVLHSTSTSTTTKVPLPAWMRTPPVRITTVSNTVLDTVPEKCRSAVAVAVRQSAAAVVVAPQFRHGQPLRAEDNAIATVNIPIH